MKTKEKVTQKDDERLRLVKAILKEITGRIRNYQKHLEKKQKKVDIKEINKFNRLSWEQAGLELAITMIDEVKTEVISIARKLEKESK